MAINGDRDGCIAHLVAANGSVVSHQFYLARRTFLQKLNDRGYAVSSSEMTRSLSDFHSKFGHKPSPETPLLRMSETPFYPREKLFAKQKYYQSIHKYTHLKRPRDKITSVAIPLAFAASSMLLIARGIYNMSHGTGKKA